MEKCGNEEYIPRTTGTIVVTIFCQVFKRLQTILALVQMLVRGASGSIFVVIDSCGRLLGSSLTFNAFASRAAFIRERFASDFFMLQWYVILRGSSAI
jgi:hypothetical protein